MGAADLNTPSAAGQPVSETVTNKLTCGGGTPTGGSVQVYKTVFVDGMDMVAGFTEPNNAPVLGTAGRGLPDHSDLRHGRARSGFARRQQQPEAQPCPNLPLGHLHRGLRCKSFCPANGRPRDLPLGDQLS